jgi:hypothetical protein
VASSGLPYIVLEYVEGDHINRYCDLQKLDIEERIRNAVGSWAARNPPTKLEIPIVRGHDLLGAGGYDRLWTTGWRLGRNRQNKQCQCGPTRRPGQDHEVPIRPNQLYSTRRSNAAAATLV